MKELLLNPVVFGAAVGFVNGAAAAAKTDWNAYTNWPPERRASFSFVVAVKRWLWGGVVGAVTGSGMFAGGAALLG